MLLGFSALALCGGLALFACAQDGADLGATGDGTTGGADASVEDSAAPGSDSGGGQPGRDSAPPPPPPPPPDDSGQPPVDAGEDAGPPPDAAPLPNGDCDLSNSAFAFIYGVEYGAAIGGGKLKLCAPGAGNCAANECCYTKLLPGCVSR